MSRKYEITEADQVRSLDEENSTYILNTITMNLTDDDGMPSCEFYAEIIEEMGDKKEEQPRDINISASELLSLNNQIDYSKPNNDIGSEDV